MQKPPTSLSIWDSGLRISEVGVQITEFLSSIIVIRYSAHCFVPFNPKSAICNPQSNSPATRNELPEVREQRSEERYQKSEVGMPKSELN
ncbi:hypothetical protein D1AOALGA4SA_9569 [Olavius algarvensis Delta 1 endosymbiont]|nr:hypothetical protein D1AOALGA4SA_9569 [Olavius algarvensis Delta 1 endosymbiont]